MSPHFTLSFELIQLMEWLLRNEQTELHQLIKKAIKNGFVSHLEQLGMPDQESIKGELQLSVINFLSYIEKLLIQEIEPADLDTSAKEKLVPTLKKIEPHAIDAKTISLSLQQTKTHLMNNEPTPPHPSKKVKKEEPTDVLFKLLLKNWKPEKNNPIN